MKRIFFSLLILLMAMAGMQARTFVLVTGVSNYGDEANNLAQTTKDAKNFAKVMSTQTKDITLLTSSNVTYANVLEKLRAICNRAQAGDRVVFFYSGHGMPGAICAYDRPIPYDDLLKVLSTSAAKEKICFVDACFAGTMAHSATDSSWMDDVADTKGLMFFLLCRDNEYSAENPFLGAGFFTQALMKGLRGKSDKNGDRKVTVLELFKYIHADVVRRSQGKQHPQLKAPASLHNVVVADWTDKPAAPKPAKKQK